LACKDRDQALAGLLADRWQQENASGQRMVADRARDIPATRR
jgi:hypothetical protein